MPNYQSSPPIYRQIMEKHLGYKLPKDMCVIHINKNNNDNRIENLKCVKRQQFLNYVRQDSFKISKEELYDLYINKKYSQRKIAEIFNCAHSTILNCLRRYNIPARSIFDYRFSRFTNEVRAKLRCRIVSEKSRKKTSQSLKNYFKTHTVWSKGKRFPERSGEKHASWRGGKIKYRGYDFKFQRLKILKRDNYLCQVCFCKAVDVHHIVPYRITKDNSLFNLVTLCKKHHKVEDNFFDRIYEKSMEAK